MEREEVDFFQRQHLCLVEREHHVAATLARVGHEPVVVGRERAADVDLVAGRVAEPALEVGDNALAAASIDDEVIISSASSHASARCTDEDVTAISALAMAQTDIPTIQKISGLKTAAMVLHYVHIFGDHVHDAISTLNFGVPSLKTA